MNSNKLKNKKELDLVWKSYCNNITKANQLYKKAGKLRIGTTKLYVEADKLCAEADILWVKAVLDFIGNVTIEWNGECECLIDGKWRYFLIKEG